MANSVKFTAFLVLSSFFLMCYSSSRPRPDDATVMLIFKLDEQDFQKKEQDFSKQLKEALPRIRFEEGNSFNETVGQIKLYKVQFTSTLPLHVRTIAEKLDIKRFFVIPPSVSGVTVIYNFPSEEHELLEELKKADIPAIRKEEWLVSGPIFDEKLEYPRDQEYIVARSLKYAAEEIAGRVGIIIKEERESGRPEYVVVKFSIADNFEFLKKLREENNIQLREIRGMWSPKLVRGYLVDYYAINRFKAIAKESGVSDIVYDMTILSPVFLSFIFRSDEYEFEEKLKEANIHFEKYEGDFGMDPKVNEYIVEANSISKVQEIARTLSIDLS